MSGRHLIDFDLDGIDNTVAKETRREAFQPITVEELIDLNNPLPMRARHYVYAATRYVQDYSARTKKEGERGFADDLVDARLTGVQSLEFQAVARLIDDLIIKWNSKQSAILNGAELRWVRARVQDNLLGAGAVEPLRRDHRVTEILVRAPQPYETVTVVNGVQQRTVTGGTRVEMEQLGLVDAPGVVFTDDDDVLAFVETLIPSNPPTNTNPLQSGTLTDGSRIEVAHRLVTDGAATFVAIRRHPERAWTLAALVDNGTINEALAEDLAKWVQMRFNVMVAGGTGSGKTSLLNALCGFINPKHHIAIIEDTREMKVPTYIYASRRVSRAARGNVGGIAIRDHIRAALRSRPDIILVGEVRGTEALDMLKAMNTGHEGSMSTCHANSAHDTILRLETMVSETGEVSESAATHAIASSVDLIVFQSRMPDGSRKVTGVYEVVKPDLNSTHRVEYVQLQPLWLYDRVEATWVKVADPSVALLEARNITINPSISEEDIRNIAEISGYRKDTK